MKVTAETTRIESSPGAVRASLRELEELDVREVFLRRWAAEHEEEPPADVLAAFDDAFAAAAGEGGA